MASYPDAPGAGTLMPRTGSPCSKRWASADERFLRAHYTELVSLGVGKNSSGLSAVLPNVNPARPERKEAVDLLVAIGTGSASMRRR
jgi:hypothetical protein